MFKFATGFHGVVRLGWDGSSALAFLNEHIKRVIKRREDKRSL
jgi:hypothetical protein